MMKYVRLYSSKLKSWQIGGFKTPHFVDRKRHCIALILRRWRSTKCDSFQSRLFANFSVYLGIIPIICLSFLLVSTLPIHSHETIEDKATLPILNPALEGRKVQKLLLDNGLQVLLISDPGVDQSAAGLAVRAG